MEMEFRRLTARMTSNPTTGELSGIAVPYNTASRPIPGAAREFREVMEPGALTYDDATVVLVNHDQDGVPLARVGAGTLTFAESDEGLRFTAQLPANRADITEALERGDLDGSMSVGMYVEADKWTHGEGQSVRRVTRGYLAEVSIVRQGAYEKASATYGGKPNG